MTKVEGGGVYSKNTINMNKLETNFCMKDPSNATNEMGH